MNLATARILALREELADLDKDSRAPCYCVDCDGEWCSGCLAHHGKRTCPRVTEVKQELDQALALLDERQSLEVSFAAWWKGRQQ